MMSDKPTVCEHGSLKRQCLTCELQEEIAELRAEVERLKNEIDRTTQSTTDDPRKAKEPRR